MFTDELGFFGEQEEAAGFLVDKHFHTRDVCMCAGCPSLFLVCVWRFVEEWGTIEKEDEEDDEGGWERDMAEV